MPSIGLSVVAFLLAAAAGSLFPPFRDWTLVEASALAFAVMVMVRVLFELARPFGLDLDREQVKDWSLILGGVFAIALVVFREVGA